MANPSDSDFANKVTLQGVHFDLSPATQAAMREKFFVLLRHDEWIVRINVQLHKDHTRSQQQQFSATGRVELRGPDLIATVHGDDAYAVLDRLAEKLNDQLRERHERKKDKRNHPERVELEAEIPKVFTD